MVLAFARAVPSSNPGPGGPAASRDLGWVSDAPALGLPGEDHAETVEGEAVVRRTPEADGRAGLWGSWRRTRRRARGTCCLLPPPGRAAGPDGNTHPGRRRPPPTPRHFRSCRRGPGRLAISRPPVGCGPRWCPDPRPRCPCRPRRSISPAGRRRGRRIPTALQWAGKSPGQERRCSACGGIPGHRPRKHSKSDGRGPRRAAARPGWPSPAAAGASCP